MEVAKKILEEMFIQRGYTEITNISAMGPAGRICVFTTERKMDNKDLEEKVNTLKREGSVHGVVIYGEPPTRNALENISEYEKIGIKFELFDVTDLQYNITKHSLVPKHTLLTAKEASEFRKKFGVQIPILLKTDPVCRFFDFPRGGIVRIDRKSGCPGFRIVR